jgi:hypothetical protein
MSSAVSTNLVLPAADTPVLNTDRQGNLINSLSEQYQYLLTFMVLRMGGDAEIRLLTDAGIDQTTNSYDLLTGYTFNFESGSSLVLQAGSTLNIAGTWQIAGTNISSNLSAARLNTLDGISATPANGSLLIGNNATSKYVSATLASADSTIAITNSAGGINLDTGTSILKSVSADSGTAVPSSGTLIVDGTNGVTTTGSGNTLTVDGISATTSDVGVVELTTGAEALTGSDSTRAVTSAALASDQTKAANGHTVLPGGIILNWGVVVATAATSVTITFEEAYTTTNYSVAVLGDAALANLTFSNKTTTAIDINFSSVSANIMYQVLGY